MIPISTIVCDISLSTDMEENRVDHGQNDQTRELMLTLNASEHPGNRAVQEDAELGERVSNADPSSMYEGITIRDDEMASTMDNGIPKSMDKQHGADELQQWL